MRDIASPLDGFASPLGGPRYSSPMALVAGASAMVWYDPSDLSTMFQDAAGTTPVTASGQPVGLIRDKSGFGFHASQSTAAARPTYTESGGLRYLAFDGVDDFLVTGTITPSADKLQIFAGLRKLSDAAAGTVVEFSANASTNNGAFILRAPRTAAANYMLSSRGTAYVEAVSPSNYAAPISNVVTGIGDISGDVAAIRVNGSQVAQSATDQGTGNYLAYLLYIGRRAGTAAPLNGQLHSLIVRFSLTNLTADQITQAEAWTNRKTGAY